MYWYDKVLYKLIFYIILWPQIFKAEKRIKPCEAIKKFHTRTIFNCMDFLRKSGKIIHKFFHIKTIAAIYSYLVIHNLGFIFLFKCASNKKNPAHSHRTERNSSGAIFAKLSRRRKCYDVYLFIGNFKSLCCNKHVIKCKMESIPK